jgi:hypothetical protein
MTKEPKTICSMVFNSTLWHTIHALPVHSPWKLLFLGGRRVENEERKKKKMCELRHLWNAMCAFPLFVL